jgi:PhzF family phenazine biosynthesis protein
MNSGSLYRLSAFTTTPDGGNPAGVWIGDQLPPPEEMQRIAADVGFSETAFLAPRSGLHRTVRYYSPEAEVPFCGHATIAAGVQLGNLHGPGEYEFEILPGTVGVAVTVDRGLPTATLTSVDPAHEQIQHGRLRDYLRVLRWESSELDPTVPSARAYAGAWHLIIAARTFDRLNHLEYDFAQLKAMMLADDFTTLQLIWRESDRVIHARNPFPVGGVVEDPATGAAAAALGGYLRDSGLLLAPANLLIRQGEAMGRASRLTVTVPGRGGIRVSGQAVRLPDDYPPLARSRDITLGAS